MLLELPLFGALAPSILIYFFSAIILFAIIDWLVKELGFYRWVWHPPLARFGLFLCVFVALVFATRV